MSPDKGILGEDVFIKGLEKRKQMKIEELVLDFLRKKRKVNGVGYTVERVAEGTGLNVSTVGFVLKTSLLYKKWIEWVEYKGVDYFHATSSA